MATLSSVSAQRIAELKDQQSQSQTQLSNLLNSENYLEIKANNNKAVAERNTAIARLAATPIDSPDRQAAVDALESAQSRSSQAFAEYAALKKQENELNAQLATYEKDIVNTAAVQTTSPSPTLEQQVAEANAAGNKAASQAISNPPSQSRTVYTAGNEAAVTFVSNPPSQSPTDYKPNLDNNVSPDSLAAGGPTAEVTKTTPNNEPVYLFNQRQNNFLESYNQNLIDSGNTKLIISDLTSKEALNLLVENGLINNGTDAPINQQPTEGYNKDGGFVVNIRGVEQQKTVTENPFDTGGVSEFGGSPAADPLDNKITELQAGQRTGTSTLPTRNQQSGTGSPKDWRFRMSLAPSANYLYKAATPGILKPLMATNGVIFPYSPQINVSYNASYSSADLVHTNYKIYNYKNSSIESVGITGEFTCQDSAEANYVLAVIHFFKSVTKMFYGQDQNPTRGTPPPLVYLTGFGQYQFDMHPVVVTSFTHTFPADVDYVNAYPTNNSSSVGGQNMAPYMPQIATFFSPLDRLRTLASNIVSGGRAPPPTFINSKNINEVTRVPAKITIQLTCLPIITRNAMSNSFSLQKYASGELMRGSVNFNKTGGGSW